jgi:uncharacterized protein YmfQ (DUF2313 family)
MKSAAILGRLLPPVSYNANGPRLSAELAAEGNTAEQLYLHNNLIRNGVTPFLAQSLLMDWERVLDVAPTETQSYQQRLERILFKLSETGGLSIPYFTRLAKSIGYTITIDEDVSPPGQNLTEPDIHWVWRVNVHADKIRVYRFRAGQSTAGERLCFFADPVIQALFEDLKPAHTLCYFTFQDI